MVRIEEDKAEIEDTPEVEVETIANDSQADEQEEKISTTEQSFDLTPEVTSTYTEEAEEEPVPAKTGSLETPTKSLSSS